MSDPSWLGFGGLAASALSALAAYLAIQQTIKQRRIANKVQLILKDNKIPVSLDNLLQPIQLNKQIEKYKITLPILNVGLGPAIKLEYEWVFDYEHFLSNINVLKIDDKSLLTGNEYLKKIDETEYSYFYRKESDRIKVGIFGFGAFHPYTQETRYTDISYILSCSVDKNQTELKIPTLIIILLIQSILKNSQDFIKVFEPIDGPTLIVRYEDVTGVKEEKIYKSSMKLETITGDSTSEHQDLIFSLSYTHAYTWTAIAHERLRKWYANCKKTILLSNNR